MFAPCPKNAAVARHQGTQEFSKRLAIPPPRLIWKALDVRLVPPQTECRQPADDGTLRNRPPKPMEVRNQAFLHSEPTHSSPGANEVRYAVLMYMAIRKLRRND